MFIWSSFCCYFNSIYDDIDDYVPTLSKSNDPKKEKKVRWIEEENEAKKKNYFNEKDNSKVCIPNLCHLIIRTKKLMKELFNIFF